MSNIWDKMLDNFINTKSKKQPVCDDFETFSQKDTVQTDDKANAIKYDKLEKDITNLTVPVFTEENAKPVYEDHIIENAKQTTTETTVNSIKIKKAEEISNITNIQCENGNQEQIENVQEMISMPCENNQCQTENNDIDKKLTDKTTKAAKKTTKKSVGRPRKK
ncbi:MAG: hypothetical protein [Wendovervirus sonii]|uniref:Uncharacterized protein n=1 Tax=phage Lak_Megaphage_Sonny TaxID=3109229 RepID=A0ABZ0Z5K9_9CAUD|nr:MAG: hypothetical protein [phage Lak_Megaphage_Sonny]